MHRRSHLFKAPPGIVEPFAETINLTGRAFCGDSATACTPPATARGAKLMEKLSFSFMCAVSQ
jgi:hypothetical protein